MPVDQHSDPFEEELADALRHTGGAFETDRAALAAGGRARGRRLRLRRRAAVLSGVAGIAAVGVGGALLLPGGSGDSRGGDRRSVAAGPAVASASSAPAGGAVSGDDVLGTLKDLLPDGEFSAEESSGAGERASSAYAKVVHDDGHGPAAVAVSIGRTATGGAQARSLTQCPDDVLSPHDGCTATTLPGGSRLMVLKGYEYPDRRVDTKRWLAVLVTARGQQVSLSEWNAAAEKNAPVSRPEPPLSPGELKRVVTDERWLALVDALPETPKQPSASTSAAPPAVGTRVPKLLAAMMPEGVDVVHRGGEGEYGYVVADDGRGRSLVQINVQPDMSDVADQLYGSAVTLPDGTKVATRQGPGEKGGEGVVMWTVDTMRPDGRRVVVSAFNTGAQHEDATRDAPVLSMGQLRAVALDQRWDALG